MALGAAFVSPPLSAPLLPLLFMPLLLAGRDFSSSVLSQVLLPLPLLSRARWFFCRPVLPAELRVTETTRTMLSKTKPILRCSILTGVVRVWSAEEDVFFFIIAAPFLISCIDLSDGRGPTNELLLHFNMSKSNIFRTKPEDPCPLSQLHNANLNRLAGDRIADAEKWPGCGLREENVVVL